MRSITFATVTVIFAHFAVALANESPSPTVGPTETPPATSCDTFTTAGPTCPVYSCSAIPACLALSTLTISCGCSSIYTEFACTNPCTNSCLGTSWITVADPACPTPPPDSSSPSSYPTDSITITTDTSTTTAPPETSPPETSPPETSTIESSTTRYSNSTITSTNIITVTTCPASVTCTGQTTTWTSSSGPFPCTASPTCTCVLPGAPNVTVTGGATQSTSQGNTPPQPTTSIVPAGAGKSVVVGGGLLAGLIAAIGLL